MSSFTSINPSVIQPHSVPATRTGDQETARHEMQGKTLTGIIGSTPQDKFKLPPWLGSAHWSVYAQHDCGLGGRWQELKVDQLNLCAKIRCGKALWPPQNESDDPTWVYAISDEKGYTKTYWRFNKVGRCVSAEGQAVHDGKVPIDQKWVLRRDATRKMRLRKGIDKTKAKL
jgi:hypothetical protein